MKKMKNSRKKDGEELRQKMHTLDFFYESDSCYFTSLACMTLALPTKKPRQQDLHSIKHAETETRDIAYCADKNYTVLSNFSLTICVTLHDSIDVHVNVFIFLTCLQFSFLACKSPKWESREDISWMHHRSSNILQEP
jgi:hypothetical protein